MSTGNIKLDILLNRIQEDYLSGSTDAISEILKRYPKLSPKEALEIHSLIVASKKERQDEASLVVTAPPSFSITAKATKVVVEDMLNKAEKSILITGYSLSEYFNDLIDGIIQKSQKGVLVKFYGNNIEIQKQFARLCMHKGKFLKIYNYPRQSDKMSALHAKVISVDQSETLITSANLSYHGQEGNIELGVQVQSQQFARQVEDVFTKLLFKKVFVEY